MVLNRLLVQLHFAVLHRNVQYRDKVLILYSYCTFPFVLELVDKVICAFTLYDIC